MSHSEDLLNEIARGTADQVLERLQARAESMWDELPEERIRDVRAAALDLSELLLRQAAGEEVGGELDLVEATLANWAWVGASRVRSALLEETKVVAGIVGGALRALIVGLL